MMAVLNIFPLSILKKSSNSKTEMVGNTLFVLLVLPDVPWTTVGTWSHDSPQMDQVFEG